MVEGGDGNDRITGIDGAIGQFILSGDSGSDKIDMGENHTATAQAFGGSGHDLIYGADDSAAVRIYGDKDYGYGIGAGLTTGGKDKIYGGDNNASL